MHFAVCGLHLSKGPLNYQLTDIQSRLIRATKSAPRYTLHALSSEGSPTKPGMIYHPLGGPHCGSISLEVWDVPDNQLGALYKFVPSPLALGTVFLEDGSSVKGFVCEGWASDPAACKAVGITTEDITKYGGWREWVSANNQTSAK
ncbi:Allophanate hydrolase [Gracilariopsis chorda]|uniref:Allophanate hydrolase n=1 Tax=Gracilariopsis chorda TaxID=448386 RepID=A0A2V3IZA0_9FLOR|nr:Allophanate hydrolase [Gracilariopsis chorda]|eukprot:PXF47383.1 Allophanate hydrolase [Gracilariopsis chorda]